MIVFDKGSYLRQCILVAWCRVLQSEFCDGLRITSRKPLKLRYNFISRCSKADYPYNRRSGNTELKSYHGSGSGQGDI